MHACIHCACTASFPASVWCGPHHHHANPVAFPPDLGGGEGLGAQLEAVLGGGGVGRGDDGLAQGEGGGARVAGALAEGEGGGLGRALQAAVKVQARALVGVAAQVVVGELDGAAGRAGLEENALDEQADVRVERGAELRAHNVVLQDAAAARERWGGEGRRTP